MGVKAISEIIKEVCEIESRKEKIEYLKRHDSQTLRNILILTYDKTKKFYIPSSVPPFTVSQAVDNHGMMYKEARKLKYIVEGFSDPSIPKIKRESIFINMLETVHKDDADVLLNMIQKKRYPGLTVKMINEAFGKIITT